MPMPASAPAGPGMGQLNRRRTSSLPPDTSPLGDPPRGRPIALTAHNNKQDMLEWAEHHLGPL